MLEIEEYNLIKEVFDPMKNCSIPSISRKTGLSEGTVKRLLKKFNFYNEGLSYIEEDYIISSNNLQRYMYDFPTKSVRALSVDLGVSTSHINTCIKQYHLNFKMGKNNGSLESKTLYLSDIEKERLEKAKELIDKDLVFSFIDLYRKTGLTLEQYDKFKDLGLLKEFNKEWTYRRNRNENVTVRRAKVLLEENPDITFKELSKKLNITLMKLDILLKNNDFEGYNIPEAPFIKEEDLMNIMMKYPTISLSSILPEVGLSDYLYRSIKHYFYPNITSDFMRERSIKKFEYERKQKEKTK